METYFWMVNKCGFKYYGDINQKIDLTSQEDTAKFVISAIKDKNRSGDIKIFGQELSTKEIVDTYNKVLGRKEQAKFMGSIDDLKKEVNELREKGKLFDSLQLAYEIPMFDGTGKIKDRMNSQFSDVKTMTLEGFLQKTQGKVNYEYTIPDVVKYCEKQILSH